MELLVNDLSLHGQYQDLTTFREAIARVMTMRQLARQLGSVLYCHRNLARAQVTQGLSMPQAIQKLSRDERVAFMQWLTTQGPFWEDSQLHQADDYLAYKEDVVTDTALGEAAYCCLLGMSRDIVSFTPSSWQFTPIPIVWVHDETDKKSVKVINYWTIANFEAALRAAPLPITSWEQLEAISKARFSELSFSIRSFKPLRGIPFSHGVANRILERLDVLNQVLLSRNKHGKFTIAGQQLYQDFFVGEKAWFSDSSDREKQEFNDELTFRHPEKKGEYLFCSWHGKVKTPQIRIHFSWPPQTNESIYVLYIGPKITKR